MLKANLRGQVRQTPLWKGKALLPLFEAVVNSFQSIGEAKDRHSHSVSIQIERDADLGLDGNSIICGFSITDTGVGFNDENFDSFNTSFSEYKYHQGGKGLGRIIWLKAFERVEIDSVFREPDSTSLLRRKFIFDEDYDPEMALPFSCDFIAPTTVVTLKDFKEPYKSECPRTAESIAQRLIEHFLLILLEPNCPAIEIIDLGVRFSINEIFDADFRAAATIHEFQIKEARFTLHGFQLSTPRVTKHRLVYAANQRAVVSDNLEEFIPNLSSRLPDNAGGTFAYLAIVQSPYLTTRVNHARTDFDLGHPEDAEPELPSLLPDEIRRSDIRESCLKHIEDDLSVALAAINSAKDERLLKFVQDEAPQYKVLLKYRNEFLSRISPTATKAEIDSVLHREIYQREVKLKQEGSKIIKEAEKIDDYETYQARLSEFMEKYNELGVSALAQYVGHRKIILDFLDRAISRDPETQKYPLEKVVHQLIFPMRSTDQDTPYEQQNLWIIDERLNFHSFISSDKQLSSLPELQVDSAKRPDLLIFDKKIAFTEGDQPLNSLVVVEFKRPQLDNYTADKNPLTQAFEMINEIRTGTFKDGKGHQIAVANNGQIPANCHIICDITSSMRKVLTDFDATATPDNQGYYGYHRTHRIYYEVTDYGKLLRDAKKRNRIFFDKLNILGNK